MAYREVGRLQRPAIHLHLSYIGLFMIRSLPSLPPLYILPLPPMNTYLLLNASMWGLGSIQTIWEFYLDVGVFKNIMDKLKVVHVVVTQVNYCSFGHGSVHW